ncbi:hypothetical protein G3T14_21440 [Methylobacterium sp. BTF04]|uniref:hypothetical protein n=1 Tax=Methylobacterium sp. BTF04 TaxID=2708300 RepID=UPI0013D35B16|nr:hypothetical protein [Methylobacterium sp. BTF04]NEU14651.1 hypothetical protein [Methylobacterium sp. BTF04]
MNSEIHITDHALLIWMQEVHGIDVEGWRDLMLVDLQAALDVFDGDRTPGQPAFIVSQTGESVITFVAAGQEPSRVHRRTIAIARAVA